MKIKELILLTNDLTGTKNFYTSILKLPVLEEHEDFISFRTGATVLVFHLSTIVKTVYHFAFNIPCNKIEEALQWCETAGLELIPYLSNKIVDFPNWNAKSLYFFDNNGNILEFIARYDLKNETDEPFNEKQILNVSEIGIVMDDVIAFCETAIKEYAIPYYEKQKPSPNFSVLGDAEGLMIVVPEKRNWFLTTIPSMKVPVEVTFVQDEKEFVFRN